MTGRNGVDVPTAAFEASRQAELIFRHEPDDPIEIEYSEPISFEIDGAPAVRYTANASNIAQKYDCDPADSSFDVVATEGYSNATVAVFMVQADQHIDGALVRNDIDQIVSSLRRQSKERLAMDQEFSAMPNEVSGLGRLVSEVGLQTHPSYKYFNEHAMPLSEYSGEILQSLLTPFNSLRDVWRDRHVHLSDNCSDLGEKLNVAAWLYAHQEKQNYEALNAHTQLVPAGFPGADPGDSNRPAAGTVELYFDPKNYGQPDGVDYPAPETLPNDVAQVIADAAGWLAG